MSDVGVYEPMQRWLPRLVQAAAIARSGPDDSTTLGVTAALSSLRMIHSSLRLETNHQLMM
jgi:hypothetical protein